MRKTVFEILFTAVFALVSATVTVAVAGSAEAAQVRAVHLVSAR